MIPRDKLEKLQHQCKGLGKEDLYHLIGVQGTPPDHQDLLERLDRKCKAWSKMADKAVHLAIVEKARKLLQTPSDKAEYDLFLQSPAEPQAPTVSPQQPPWGYEQPPMPPQQPAQPKRRAGTQHQRSAGHGGAGTGGAVTADDGNGAMGRQATGDHREHGAIGRRDRRRASRPTSSSRPCERGADAPAGLILTRYFAADRDGTQSIGADASTRGRSRDGGRDHAPAGA